MRLAGREIPEVTLIDISNVGPAYRVENRHAGSCRYVMIAHSAAWCQCNS